MQPKETMHPATLLGIVVAFAAGAGLLAFVAPALLRRHEAAVSAERGWAATPADTRQARAAQSERLAHYAWIDQPKGVVALPIERAMELVLPELRGKEPGR